MAGVDARAKVPAAEAPLAQGRLGGAARRRRQAADEPAAVELPAGGRALPPRSPRRPGCRSPRCWSAPGGCSTSGSSARSPRSSTPAPSGTPRCWSRRRWTRRTRSAPAAIVNSHPGRLPQLPAHPRLQPLVHDRHPARFRARPRADARGADARDRRLLDAPASDPHPVQDQHEPGDGEGHRGARRRRRVLAAPRAGGAAL